MTLPAPAKVNNTEKPDPDRFKNVEFERLGKKVIIPEGMEYDDLITWAQRRKEDETKNVGIDEVINAYPLDGALALAHVLAREFGWADMRGTPGWFGENPPQMIGLEYAFNKTVQVPWGRFYIPTVKGYLETGFTKKDGRFLFQLSGVVKNISVKAVNKLANQVREEVLQNSIYRGKAIQMTFPSDGEKFSPLDHMPKFMDTSRTNVDDLIFAESVQNQVQTNLLTPIEKTEACRKAGIPLKRGVLLAGPFGVGKTLVASVVAKKCEENNWTYIYLKTVDDLAQAISIAQLYQPAVIFAEDIDSVMNGERDTNMNDILNTLDGVDSKNADVFVILTTNFVERINKAMLRPGRLDAIIEVSPPDAKAVVRLIQLYSRGTLKQGEDLTPVAHKLAGKIPATIREVVERAKLSAIYSTPDGEEFKIKAIDLTTAADTMLGHLKLMEETPEDTRKPLELFAEGLGAHIENAAVRIHKERTNGATH